MPVPAGWAAQQALGLVVNWPTALAALKPLGGIGAGQTVLIHAAAGGTGQAAVTLAKHYGATVIATASPAKHQTVRALGAAVMRTGEAAWSVNGVGVGGFATPAAALDFGNSGTGCRLVLGAVGGCPVTATCSARSVR